jgi:hypothetical protein
MPRYIAILAAVALLVAGCGPGVIPGPTAVVRPTERPALYTQVPTFTPTAPPVPTATRRPSSTPAPTVAPTEPPTATPPPTATVPPTLPPSPTPAPTKAPTKAPTRRPSTPVPSPTSAPAAGGPWRGEYFANADLYGTPALVRNDADVNFDWGLDAPAPGLPTDHFSVRWTRNLSLPEGRWRFHATSDDGVRVWVDGIAIIDQWHTTGAVTYNTTASLSGGNHEVRVDYYDNVEDAKIQVWWEADDGSATDPSHSGAWRGDYYDNRSLSGGTVFGRDDPVVYFDWGDNGPGAGIGGQEFSVRWTRQVYFPAGPYQFTVKADDGVRLWFDWHAIIDEWHDGYDKTYQVQRDVKEGLHTVVVEYYQGPGSAEIKVAWEPTNYDWLANLHTCLLTENSWVNVYRLAPNDQWEQLPTENYGVNQGGELSLWGLPVDATYSWDGQPYRVELWVNGKMTASQGNIFAGEPAFRITPGMDAHTSWPCGSQLPR